MIARTGLPHRLIHGLAFVLWLVLPLGVTASWRWYRRLYGGQWSRGPDGRRWRPVKACPGLMWAELLGAGPVPVGVCYESEALGRECHCEVWS